GTATGGCTCARHVGAHPDVGTAVTPRCPPPDPQGNAGDSAGTTITPLTCPDGAVSTIHNPHHLPRHPYNITVGRRDDPLGATEQQQAMQGAHTPHEAAM